jgi:WD40 repeat protein
MQIPVIFLAFANDKVDAARYLRNLPMELDGIRNVLLPAVKANLCEVIERANATIEHILDTFQDERYRDRVAIFHYGGHADGYQLLLESLDGSHAVAQGGGLVSFFSKQKGLKLVFFNGCSTHQQSVELVQAGIPAVVGTSNAISDDIATDLSIRFYKGMAQGMTLEHAWNAAIDEIKIKKGEANTRGLYRKEAAAKMEDERFPWELLIREGAEIVKEFNLPSEVNNPLFGLPKVPQYHLPALPYEFLKPYKEEHAEVLFGRARYIRDLYNRITDKNSTSIITICGQAGVGKSSLFDAGLVPRLRQSHEVEYLRRDQSLGLLGTLEAYFKIAKTEEEKQEEIAEAREASFSFEQKPIETMHIELLSDYGANVEIGNQTVLNNLNPSQSISNHQQSTTNNQLLIEQLKNLANSADASIQPFILKLIQDLENSNQNIQHQIIENQDFVKCESKVLERWLQIEQESGKPLVIILDQVEEVYTRPMANLADLTNEEARVNIGEHEIQTFLEEIKKIFDNPNKALLPKGKLLLGFRKEFQPDFEEWFKHFQIPQNKVFIDILKRNEVIEIVQGLTSSERLRRNYRVSIETGLAEIIADDLLEDKDSAVAPILQLILTKLWKSCENDESRIFMTQKYQNFRREGLLMKDFVNDQLMKMREWNPELEQSGLVLDILMQHTTGFGTAGTKTIEELTKSYQYIRKPMISILEKAKEMYLLVDLGQRTGLAHDAIAPVVIEKYTESMYPGQRALRLIKSKMPNFDPENPRKKDNSVLDERELGVVESGRNGMVMWDKDTIGRMIEESERRKKLNKQKRRWRRVGFVASIIVIIAFAIYSQTQRKIAKSEQTRAEASQLITLAVQNDDMTMALRLAERADSLATSVEDNTLKDKFIEIVATNNFYYSIWHDQLMISKVCIDEDGRKFLFLDAENNLRIRDYYGQYIFGMTTEGVYDFDLSPDGRKVLFVDAENVARLYDMNYQLLLSLTKKEQYEDYTINKAGFLPNGNGIYIVNNNLKISFFDFKGKEFFTYKAKFPSETIYDITLAPDVESMAIFLEVKTPSLNSFYELRTWNIDKNELIYKQTQDDYINQFVFAPDSQHLLIASDTTASLRDTRGALLSKWRLPDGQGITQARFSPDSKYIWTSHSDRTVRMYETQQVIDYYQSEASNYILPLKVLEDDNIIESMHLTPDNHWLMTVNQYYGIKFWSIKNNYKVLHGGINDGLSKVAFAPDGKKFYSMLDGGVLLNTWQMRSDSTSFEQSLFNLSDDSVPASISFDGKHILKCTDTIQLLDVEFRMLTQIPLPYGNYRVNLSADSEHIITLYGDTVQVFDKEGKSISIIKEKGNDAFLSPDNQYLVAINEIDNEENTTARLYEVKSGKLIQTLKGHTEFITAVSFSPDSKYLATASEDYTAKIWNIRGEEITTLRGHSQKINCLTFSPQGNYVLTGSDDYTARLWNLSGQELNIYTAHKVNSLAFAPDGTQFISAGTQDFDQKDFFNISMNRKTSKAYFGFRQEGEEKDKYTVSSIILWDKDKDQKNLLKSGFIANFMITDYLEAGASISPKTLLDLDNTTALNTAGGYYLESKNPISGVSTDKRLRYAEKLFEKSLEIGRSKEGVIGITNVIERQTEPANTDFMDKLLGIITLKKRNWGTFDVDEMLNTKDIGELQDYMKYIYDNKLDKAKNRADSLKYWKGLKKIAEKSLSIRETPQAVSTLKNANYALGDVKSNFKMTFSNNLDDMRKYVSVFEQSNYFKKQSLLQAVLVYEHILKNLKSTSEDAKNAAKAYNELAWEQLMNKETIEAEKSMLRGLELDKNNRYLFINQVLIYLYTQRYAQAQEVYKLQLKNGKLPNEGSFKEMVNEKISQLEQKGMKIEEAKKKELIWLK